MLSVFILPSARASNSDVIWLASLMTTVIFWSCLLELGPAISEFSGAGCDVWPTVCSFSARSIETVVARLLMISSPHGIDLALFPLQSHFPFNLIGRKIGRSAKKMRYLPYQLPCSM